MEGALEDVAFQGSRGRVVVVEISVPLAVLVVDEIALAVVE